MALTFSEKKEVVAEVAEVAAKAHSAVAAEYRGLTVGQLTALRVKARENGVYLRVVKNSLARLAIEGTDFECMKGDLKGPLLLAFSVDDPGAAARILREFAKDNDKLVPAFGAIGGQPVAQAELAKLADMPTYDQSISMLMSVMQAPVAKFVRTLNEVPGKLVRTVEAVRQAK
ncbi:50S ribosomal protein L10 [Granulosicoccaceae sp. 1_MG-2023]|nr:50S ribosomal protein L10 [Granulosicoccaceae sp. 1_MG-2023]